MFICFQVLSISKMDSVVSKYHLCIPFSDLSMSNVYILLISSTKYKSRFRYRVHFGKTFLFKNHVFLTVKNKDMKLIL
jgi:hypothetical protein